MARDQISIAGNESGSFEKITQGLRHAIEGAAELAMRRSDDRWGAVAITLEQTLKLTQQLAFNAQVNSNVRRN